MSHECHMEESGYPCPVCESERAKQEEDETIANLLKKWNWNSSIFDIYDELKEDYEDDEEMLEKILSAAHKHFNCDATKQAIKDLAFHFSVIICEREVNDDQSDN